MTRPAGVARRSDQHGASVGASRSGRSPSASRSEERVPAPKKPRSGARTLPIRSTSTRRSRRSIARSGSPSRKRASTRASSPTSCVELGYVSDERRPAGDRGGPHRRPPAGAAAARAGCDHRRPALARGRRALRPRPRRPLRLPGRHGGGEPDLGQHRAPLPARCRSASSTRRRCWSRWPTRPTCSRSTTSRSRPALDCRVAVAAEEDIEALIGRLNTLQSAVSEAITEGDEPEAEEGELAEVSRHAKSAPRTRR